MNTETHEIDYDKLASLVAKKLAALTLDMHPQALWGPKDVGLYLKRSASFAYSSALDEPDFPARVRLDDKPRNPVWYAGEVVAWVAKRNSIGRPRTPV